jgi:hypothetical protein
VLLIYTVKIDIRLDSDRGKETSSSAYLPFFVGWLISNLRYMYLLAHSGVPHILCGVFALFFFVLCTLICQFKFDVAVL